ncbi:hypothetical protein [Candidatus Poriferisodalis sp.]|uniref:hypothetical protein n=1 Tax=Candidatus Poriferisodalis sp. TaxID=3101277 RepID=UPI003B0179EA
MAETVTTAQRKQRWHRPRSALPPGHEPGNHTPPASRWSWRWNWVRPRDGREGLARLALCLIVPAWWLLVDPLGSMVATVGMIGSLAIACPAYANWQRRRTPAPKRGQRHQADSGS